MTESWINVDSEEILNPKGPSCWPAPKDAELEQGDEVKSYFTFNWSWGGWFILVDSRGAFAIKLSEGGPERWGMGTEVIWVVGRWCVTIPVHRACWETPSCQMEISKLSTKQRCWCFILIMCFVSIRQCAEVWGLLWMERPIFKWFFATSKTYWASRRDPGEHQGTPCFPLSLEGI